MNTLPLPHAVILHKNPEYPFIYDVELNNVGSLKRFHSVEVHLVLYPFSRQITSDAYRFNPFEEYANDISTSRRSLYTRVPHPAGSIFGIFVGVLIILLFLIIKPSEVASLQSLVAILGAYFIGKDLWKEIESLLVAVTKNWSLRYQTGYYQYQLEKNTTLTNYSALARERRYGKASLLPEQMDFIGNANSKTVRLKFTQNDLRSVSNETVHILGIRIDPALADEFAQAGFMLSAKVTLSESRGLLIRSHEYFQSLNAGERGCLNFENVWTRDAALARETLFLGSLRYLAARRLVPASTLVWSGK